MPIVAGSWDDRIVGRMISTTSEFTKPSQRTIGERATLAGAHASGQQPPQVPREKTREETLHV